MGGARRHTPAARRLRPRRRVPAGRRKEAIGTHTGRTRATPQCRGAPDSASTDKITAHMRARRMCLPTAEARLAGDTRAAADLSAWLVVEDESGQGLRPPKGRSWGRRGRTPVVHVTAANAPRLSVAALVAVKPGVRPRLIYRTRRTRRGRRASRCKGFTEADYAALLDAAHQQLGGPLVLVWDNLNTHTSKAMAALIAARPWLTVYRLPPYAHELNPVESVWSHLKRSLANLTKHTIAELTALVKTRLKRMQYRPALLAGFLASTGLEYGPFL